MAFSTRSILIGAAGVALVGGLIVMAFREDPLPVDLAEISRGPLVITVDAEGETRIRDIYDVSAPIDGMLQRMPLQVGDPVQAGKTLVAEVRPAASPLLDARARAEATAVLHETAASIRFAEAEVTRTQADLSFAQSQFDRTQALATAGTSSLTQLEDANLRLELAKSAAISAEARVAMARAANQRAQAVLDDPAGAEAAATCCTALLAPADGVVLSQPNASARPVLAGEKLLSVGDPTNLEVVVDLLSADATRLRVGATAQLDRWGGDAPLEAELRRLEPSARTVVSALGIEEQRVDAVLDLTSPPADWAGLGQGFAVFVRIEEWRVDDALLVPLSAVFQQDDQWFTFVESGGLSERRPISIGRRDGQRAVVLEGLEAGERVVTHPPDTLTDGSRIVVRERL